MNFLLFVSTWALPRFFVRGSCSSSFQFSALILYIFFFRSVSSCHCYLCFWVVHSWWPLWFVFSNVYKWSSFRHFYRFIANYILTNTIILILLVSMSKLPGRYINFTGTLFHFLLSTIFVRQRFVLVCIATKAFHLVCLVDTFKMQHMHTIWRQIYEAHTIYIRYQPASIGQ